MGPGRWEPAPPLGDLVLDGDKRFLSDENLVTHGEVRCRLGGLVPPLGLPGGVRRSKGSLCDGTPGLGVLMVRRSLEVG